MFYFSRRIPKDIRHKYEHDKFVMCLRTKSREAAARSARAIAARLDEYWMSLRIAGLGIPKMLANPDTAVEGPTITLSQALENYHSLKGTGKDDLFFRYLMECLGHGSLTSFAVSDAGQFRDYLFAPGISSSSVWIGSATD